MMLGINESHTLSCSPSVRVENEKRKMRGGRREKEGDWRWTERCEEREREILLLNIISTFKSNYTNLNYLNSRQMPVC